MTSRFDQDPRMTYASNPSARFTATAAFLSGSGRFYVGRTAAPPALSRNALLLVPPCRSSVVMLHFLRACTEVT